MSLCRETRAKIKIYPSAYTAYTTDERRLNKSQVPRIKPSCLVLFFFPLGYFYWTSWLFFFRWVEMKNPLKKWLAIRKSRLIAVAGNPQTSYEKRSNKNTCYYCLIGERTKRSLLSHSLGQSYQVRKLYLRSTASVLEAVQSPDRLVHFLLAASVA